MKQPKTDFAFCLLHEKKKSMLEEDVIEEFQVFKFYVLTIILAASIMQYSYVYTGDQLYFYETMSSQKFATSTAAAIHGVTIESLYRSGCGIITSVRIVHKGVRAGEFQERSL